LRIGSSLNGQLAPSALVIDCPTPSSGLSATFSRKREKGKVGEALQRISEKLYEF